MIRTVVMTMYINASEYDGCEDTPEGMLDLAEDMVRGNADFPRVVITTDQDADPGIKVCRIVAE